MITKTKNSTFAAIISLSLLMASMPIKAENDPKAPTKKALRCSWHAAKIAAGILTFKASSNLKHSFVEQKETIDFGADICSKLIGDPVLNFSGVNYYPNLNRNLHADEIKEQMPEMNNKLKQQKKSETTINNNLWLIKTVSLVPIISGCVGLAQEFGLLKNKTSEENQQPKNQQTQTNSV